VKFRITHTTQYEYEESIPLSHNIVRLRPRDFSMQTCLRHELIVIPAPAVKTVGLDYFGNHVTWFSLQESHTALKITSESEVQVDPATRPDLTQGPSWEQVLQILAAATDAQTLATRQFSFESPHVPLSAELAGYARVSFGADAPFLQCVLDLTERIYHDFKFLPGSTDVGTPVADVFHTRQGVCQDFAHLQIGCLRSMGFAARYVSGYVATHPPPGEPRLTGADASHAWVSVYAPDHGWVDFDPTNGLMPSDAHITVAWGRDYDDVGPAKGILIGGQRHWMDVAVDVVPFEES
jgi:transglutaminase-like putative cysteine protease